MFEARLIHREHQFSTVNLTPFNGESPRSQSAKIVPDVTKN